MKDSLHHCCRIKIDRELQSEVKHIKVEVLGGCGIGFREFVETGSDLMKSNEWEERRNECSVGQSRECDFCSGL